MLLYFNVAIINCSFRLVIPPSSFGSKRSSSSPPRENLAKLGTGWPSLLRLLHCLYQLLVLLLCARFSTLHR